jgi:hypothetical protein
MPGTITHNWILYRALRTFETAWGPTGRVKASHDAARSYGRTPKKDKPSKTNDLVFAGCAYLGCCGPDLFYLDLGSTGTFIADLLHYNRSGLYMTWWLSELKKDVETLESSTLGNDMLREYAYILGHISHIAADITIHPYVNSIVQAYPTLAKDFENSRGWNPMNLWRFHNILEHHQDSYILHEKFFGQEGFDSEDWENANVARHASDWFVHHSNPKTYFIVNRSRAFYRYGKNYKADLETDKHKFFLSENRLLNLSTYYDATIPDRATMHAHASLVQKDLFESYLDAAVAMTCALYAEVERYLQDESASANDPELKAAKSLMPTLRRHWNLDCGLAPAGAGDSPSWKIARPDTQMCVAGSLVFNAANGSSARDDVRLPLAWEASTDARPREAAGGSR